MIITTFFTFICLKENKLFQSNLCDYDLNKDYLIEVHDLNHLGYRSIRLNDDYFVFERQGQFLSAVSDNTLTSQPCGLLHETFRLVEGYRPPCVPVVRSSMGIPKIIHQAETTHEIRDIYRNNVEMLILNNKEYSYKFYNKKDIYDIIYDYFGWDILQIFLRINPRYGAAQVDLFRYLCMYKWGGVYLDMKSGCQRPLREIIQEDDHMLLSHWDSVKSSRYHGWGRHPAIAHRVDGEYQQWFIISQAGNVLLEKVINQVLASIELYDPVLMGTGREATLSVTGPTVFTRAIEGHLPYHHTRLIDAENEGLEYEAVKGDTRLTDYRQETLPLIL